MAKREGAAAPIHKVNGASLGSNRGGLIKEITSDGDVAGTKATEYIGGIPREVIVKTKPSDHLVGTVTKRFTKAAPVETTANPFADVCLIYFYPLFAGIDSPHEGIQLFGKMERTDSL
jgi:hypothetical protein